MGGDVRLAAQAETRSQWEGMGEGLHDAARARRAVRTRALLATGSFAALVTGCSSGSKPTPVTGTPAIVQVANDQDEFPVAKPTGLAPTPPMGWSTWNAYHTHISASLIKRAADAMVSLGLRDAGYEYVNIDDGWALTPRGVSASGKPEAIAPDPTKFPPAADGRNGIQVVADYVHARGLKLGIYSDRGTATCDNYTASGGFEKIDAQAFASWGVDYLKYDNCRAVDVPMRPSYAAMRSALDAAIRETGHEVLFGMCSWEFNEWNLDMAQSWRTTLDISHDFDDRKLLPNRHTWTILQIASLNSTYAAYASPNHWNDADMLEVGNFGTDAQAEVESRTHFNMWAMMSSPLIAGANLDGIDEQTRAILTNHEVIAVDQDYLGLQGALVKSDATSMIWAKPLNKAGARAVLLVNTGTTKTSIGVTLPQIGLSDGAALVHDMWTKVDSNVEHSFSAVIAPLDSVMVEIDGQEPGIPQGTAPLTSVTWTHAADAEGQPFADRSRLAMPIKLNGTTYGTGLGVAAASKVIYRLARRCTDFSAVIGVDDATNGEGSVEFEVWADGEKLFPASGQSSLFHGNDRPVSVHVDLTGKYRMTLVVTNGGDGADKDYADWADAKLTCAP